MTTPTDYPLRAVCRITGLSEHVVRAWERRHAAVTPRRTPGGTRRYSEADVERLQLLARVVAAGHGIGEVARLSDAELRARIPKAEPGTRPALDPALEAIQRLDAPEAERLISLQLSALGPVRFAREFALPLLEEIGRGWTESRLCVASEHLASAILRSLLGTSLRANGAGGPSVVFAAPSGEHHELGVLIAAVTAQAAGARAVYLGPDLPLDELVDAVATIGAKALVLGLTVTPAGRAAELLRELRERLPAEVELWAGGATAASLEPAPGVEIVADLDRLEHRVSLLGAAR